MKLKETNTQKLILEQKSSLKIYKGESYQQVGLANRYYPKITATPHNFSFTSKMIRSVNEMN